MQTVFNQKTNSFLEQPMFFGDHLNTQRFDVFKYPIFDKLTQMQLSLFWRPEEVSLQKDRNDFQILREEQKFIFTANLKYQTLLDSVQGRGPALALLPHCSLPELESCILTWDFFETIHSRSYTHIMKNVYSDPTEILDTILTDKAILARAVSVTKYYDDFLQYAKDHNYSKQTASEFKRRLYLALVAINILEGIRFYVSFACTFAFGELKLMEGSAKIISLIARDEAQHLAISQHIINAYKQNEKDQQMIDIIGECEPLVYQMYDAAVEEERAWAVHLFQHGSMIGLNAKLLGDYIEFMANKRMKAIGLSAKYKQSASNNPLPWTQNWLNTKGLQEAPQETEKEAYLVGSIKQDIDLEQLKEFKL